MNEISLMFAVEAEQLLLAGLPEEAIELCNQGLELYPNYASAISVLARAYASFGNIQKANQVINSAQEYLPKNIFTNIKESFDKFEIPSSNTFAPANTLDLKVDEIASFIDDSVESDSFLVEEIPILIDDSTPTIDDEFVSSYDIPNDFTVENDISPENAIEINNDKLSDKEETSEFDLTSSSLDEDSEKFESIDNNGIFDIETEFEIDKTLTSENFIKPEVSQNDEFRSSNVSIIPGLDRFGLKPSNALFSSNKPARRDKVIKIVRKQSDFMSIISSLNRAEVIKSDYSPKNDRHKVSTVVTETIASILVQQGALSEAKAAYLELSTKHPEKKKEFKKKIAEIDAKLK